ncbi:hypothetical protein DPMN_041262 [Dreissena polymorpha]|uniref:Uncharacterized protein n=1 Tax=Dreissena polymorpha TaxID=45954 RepID=A0A9D4HW21_DREPO|nr:hypothetical protein DPMN_041262 [Dreissena polymorpha]
MTDVVLGSTHFEGNTRLLSSPLQTNDPPGNTYPTHRLNLQGKTLSHRRMHSLIPTVTG